MPENFSSLLEALNDEGRELARPVPAGVIETVGRGRRRRHRFTAAGSALAVCALAAGVALGTGGAGHAPAPTRPNPTPTATAPSATASGSHEAGGTKNRTGTSALMLASEPPQPNLYQWQVTSTQNRPVSFIEFPLCGYDMTGPNGSPGQPPKTLSTSQSLAEYKSATDSSTGDEVVYRFPSAAAAQHDYDMLKPNPATCKDVHVDVTLPNGFAWGDGDDSGRLHRMIVLSGTDIAYWFHQLGNPPTPYDTSDDKAALQRMAARLDGGTPVPDTNPLPAGVLPGSAWLDATQIPFGTADKSHGWYQMNGQQSAPGAAPTADLCASADRGIVNGTDATDASRIYHGTPTTTPVYPGSTYLYSGANQDIFTFPSAARAQSAFDHAHQATGKTSCQFKDYAGTDTTRTVTVGTDTATGFSLLLTDKPGPTYTHMYFVVKGVHVSTLMVSFKQGDSSTGGDAAILASMAAKLP
ncbi:hypothetical protein [Catenulispora rubra]|uniref:hypothetical protein n=1 Tax=Catenulispora rubra TaxID=280293 RepID=UPI001892422F|nr:hypothetical protein [Catenulispora rubra]